LSRPNEDGETLSLFAARSGAFAAAEARQEIAAMRRRH